MRQPTLGWRHGCWLSVNVAGAGLVEGMPFVMEHVNGVPKRPMP